MQIESLVWVLGIIGAGIISWLVKDLLNKASKVSRLEADMTHLKERMGVMEASQKEISRDICDLRQINGDIRLELRDYNTALIREISQAKTENKLDMEEQIGGLKTWLVGILTQNKPSQ